MSRRCHRAGYAERLPCVTEPPGVEVVGFVVCVFPFFGGSRDVNGVVSFKSGAFDCIDVGLMLVWWRFAAKCISFVGFGVLVHGV